MRGRVRTTVGAIAFSAVLLAGCGDDDSTETTSSSASTTQDTTTFTVGPVPTGGEPTDGSDDGSPSTTTGEPPGNDLADGTHFGYLTAFDAGDSGATGEFDLAELFTGQAAIDEAANDGQTIDGDFYIRNVSPTLRPITVAATATSSVIGEGPACCEPLPTTLADFEVDFDPPVPVVLTIEDGVVTAIVEQYFP